MFGLSFDINRTRFLHTHVHTILASVRHLLGVSSPFCYLSLTHLAGCCFLVDSLQLPVNGKWRGKSCFQCKCWLLGDISSELLGDAASAVNGLHSEGACIWIVISHRPGNEPRSTGCFKALLALF
jgi:hypothetical protein